MAKLFDQKYKIDDEFDPYAYGSQFQLTDPSQAADPYAGVNLGGYAQQLSNPLASVSAASDMPSWGQGAITAGIGATGSMIGAIAQAAAQRASLDQTTKSANLGNESSERLAKLQLATDQSAFERHQRSQAYRDMVNAYQNANNLGSSTQRAKGEALDIVSQVLATAMLKPKRRKN